MTVLAVRRASVLAAAAVAAVTLSACQQYPAQDRTPPPSSFWPCPSGQHFTHLPTGKYGCLDDNGRWPG
jgi:hypothetical protein